MTAYINAELHVTQIRTIAVYIRKWFIKRRLCSVFKLGNRGHLIPCDPIHAGTSYCQGNQI